MVVVVPVVSMVYPLEKELKLLLLYHEYPLEKELKLWVTILIVHNHLFEHLTVNMKEGATVSHLI